MRTLSRLGTAGAVLAAASLLVDGLLGLVNETDDHTSAAGAASEVLFALAMVGAVLVVVHLATRHQHPVSRGAAALAVLGLLLMAGTAVSVPIRGTEPSEGWSSLVAFGALIGLLLLGGIVIARGQWPRWIGAVVALFLPVVFFGGVAGAVIVALAWLGVAAQLREPSSLAEPAAA
jgi:hypothetical protein